jgi:hypothetical protein
MVMWLTSKSWTRSHKSARLDKIIPDAQASGIFSRLFDWQPLGGFREPSAVQLQSSTTYQAASLQCAGSLFGARINGSIELGNFVCAWDPWIVSW